MNIFEIPLPSLLCLTTILLLASGWDLRFHKIPNWLVFPAMIAALSYHTAMNGLEGLFLSFQGMGLGMALLFPFFLLGGMGAGDVKLLGAVGAILGPQGVFLAFLFTALAGGVYAFILLIFHGHLKKTILRYKIILATFFVTRNLIYIPPPASEGKPQLLYGLAIALGTFLSLSFGSRIL